MSQWRNGLAHWTSNSKVVGSSPTWDDIFGWFSKLLSFVLSKVVLYLFCLLLITPSFARLRVMFTVPLCHFSGSRVLSPLSVGRRSGQVS